MKIYKCDAMSTSIFRVSDLTVLHGSTKSFYGKAKVLQLMNGDIVLQSYDTPICQLDVRTDELTILVKLPYLDETLSNTTMKHLREFIQQYGDSELRELFEQPKGKVVKFLMSNIQEKPNVLSL